MVEFVIGGSDVVKHPLHLFAFAVSSSVRLYFLLLECHLGCRYLRMAR